ncbi:MAG: DNA methyltransferase [Verrucomicrobiales bacterium]
MSLRESLEDFVSYVNTYLSGDEKGEAAEFLDHLFRAFGHDGLREAGASREARIPKKGGKKGKKFGDLLLPDRVLVEMKSRGSKLERDYQQLFDYWTHIVPRRPPYAVLCNFDEFWIYDFNTQLFDPVDKILLAELPERAEALVFLLPEQRAPLFRNNRVDVTRKAADKLAELFRSLVARGEDRDRAQRFILQLLVGLVSEDIDLLPRKILTRLVHECRDKGASAYDLVGGLFRQMDREEPARGGRYKGVDYFNGGLFATIDPIDLNTDEITLLADAADQNWALVKPEIFGTLFQSSMDADERHAFGAHFTSEFDIQKVVGPTIVRPWREKMNAAWNRVGKLKEVLKQLRLYRVLDPACGSGNFLYVAFRELKRLEREILVRLSVISKGEPLETAVSIHQFHGLDIQPFAVELAKVTLMLAKEQEVRETAKMHETDGLLVLEKPLPLDNLDDNIRCADALFTEWPKAEAIIGNPPYLDARKMTMEYGAAYTKKVRKAFPGVPGRADLVAYWYRKAHDHLGQDGRAGLVGTNSIRQNNSREGSLDYIVAHGGTIYDAVSTQVWSGDAAVHVSIVNWIKGEEDGEKRLVTQLGDSVHSPWELSILPRIGSALSKGFDVTSAKSLVSNSSSNGCFEGKQPGHNGFRLTKSERAELLRVDPASEAVVYPYLNGREMLTASWRTDPRYIIDMGARDTFEARAYSGALNLIRHRVLPDWEANAEKEFKDTGKETGEHQNRLKRWWQLKRQRQAMQSVIDSIPRYIVCSRVTKRPIFEFLASTICPDSSLSVFPQADDYCFGILQSGVHFEWFKARCSTFESRFRYTSDTVFDTFPWPQTPTRKQIGAVAEEAVALRQLRREVMAKMDWSLRDLYRTLDDPGKNPMRDAQDRLDAAVRAAYGMPADADQLPFLLALNQTCAAKEAAGEPVVPPGLPLPAKDHAEFITKDCIQIPKL